MADEDLRSEDDGGMSADPTLESLPEGTASARVPTVSGEETLDDETSTRTRLGAVPSSYGASGGVTTPDAEHDGSGI